MTIATYPTPTLRSQTIATTTQRQTSLIYRMFSWLQQQRLKIFSLLFWFPEIEQSPTAAASTM